MSQVAHLGDDRQPEPASEPPAADRTRTTRNRRLGTALGLLLVVAALAAAVHFGTTRGLSEDRLVQRVAELQALEPERAAGDEPVSLAGLRLPRLTALGWVPTGSRVDEVADRAAATVHFARGDDRIALTVLSGQPLPPPPGGARVVRDGVAIHRQVVDGRSVVSWRRAGRTTVMSTADLTPGEQLDLVVRLTPGRRG